MSNNGRTNSIPEAVLERDLNLAMAVGAIASWSVHRRRGRSYRRFSLIMGDNGVVVWTAGMVEAFCMGVRATLEANAA